MKPDWGAWLGPIILGTLVLIAAVGWLMRAI